MASPPLDRALLQQVMATFQALHACPAHLDHLFIAWAADFHGTKADPAPSSLDEVVAAWNATPPPPSNQVPYFPITADQVRCAANLQRLGVLGGDHHLTLLGQAVIAYANKENHPFLGIAYPDDEEPAWTVVLVPEPV